MSSVNFEALLNTSMDEVEKPKPLPVGHYTFMVLPEKEFDTSSKKHTPFVRFYNRPVAPGDDVDPEAYSLVKNPTEKKLKLDFYLTEDAMFMLKEFAAKCGLETAGKNAGQLIDEIPGCMFTGEVGHDISQKDNETIFANIVNTMPAE